MLTQTSQQELVKTLTTDELTENIETKAASYPAEARKEEEDDRTGRAPGPSIGRSTRAEGAPDNGETAAYTPRLAEGNAEDDGTSSAVGSRIPHDLSRQRAQNEDDASMETLSDTSHNGFDTQAGYTRLERVVVELP
ncbi:hypothetical protein KC332_g5804 [Hortaea werneckii]|nr:hypothetical protein KC358_g5696 [Hortaea werneckii]KAI6936860.1 hypothetical protein KC348_g5892 [Hortaea werneckii]KAI6937504.1 hypothetical protein KC341_g5530 [Hortaea werneckii]KAI6973057.1 hypothetical protein KC321_g5881 [Hortaea werneckii]KAI6987783.1 hypothetical protein KC329_g5790 [Hortaea werneckii]